MGKKVVFDEKNSTQLEIVDVKFVTDDQILFA